RKAVSDDSMATIGAGVSARLSSGEDRTGARRGTAEENGTGRCYDQEQRPYLSASMARTTQHGRDADALGGRNRLRPDPVRGLAVLRQALATEAADVRCRQPGTSGRSERPAWKSRSSLSRQDR